MSTRPDASAAPTDASVAQPDASAAPAATLPAATLAVATLPAATLAAATMPAASFAEAPGAAQLPAAPPHPHNSRNDRGQGTAGAVGQDCRPTAVLMNDTSGRSHFGCERVMRLLVAGLDRHGLRIIARSPARHDWTADPAFLAALRQADVIVINGEGTLHHGRPAGLRLLSVLDHPDRGTVPVALVNALYQDNPPDWAALLQHAALIAARDSASAEAVRAAIAKAQANRQRASAPGQDPQALDAPANRSRRAHGAAPDAPPCPPGPTAAPLPGPDVRMIPDLSLSKGINDPAATLHATTAAREGILIGDSVRLAARRTLGMAAERLPAARILPTKTLRWPALHWPVAGALLRGLLYRTYMARPVLHAPVFDLAQSEAAYLAAVSATELHVTGRFHAVCLSLLTGTPFLALGSNTSKIQTLLADAGLDPSRLIGPQELAALVPPFGAHAFSGQERDAIARYLATADAGAERLFADIARLARTHCAARSGA